MKRARQKEECEVTIMDGGHRSGLGHGGEVTSSCKMPSDIRVRSSAEDTSPNRLPQEQCRPRRELTTLADEPVSSSSNCEASCESSCAELSKEEGCSGCADLKLQQRQLEEQRRLLAALHSRNCMLTALNSNLIMQLNMLRPSVPVQQESSSSHPRSLHLRIALPEEYASTLEQPSSREAQEAAQDEDPPPGGPMLHIWVNSDMAVEAVRQSMHSLVAAPSGQDWFLSLHKNGDQLEDYQTPDSLQLHDGHLMFASLGFEHRQRV